MKRTTIAMIIIAIAGLAATFTILLTNMHRRTGVTSYNVEGTGPYVTATLPNCPRLSIDEGNVHFMGEFPGFKITVDPKADAPKLSAPEDIMPYLTWEIRDSTLTLSAHNSDSLTYITLTSDRPVILTLQAMPGIVSDNLWTDLTFDSLYTSFITLQTNGNITLSNSVIDNIHLNGNNRSSRRNLGLRLEGKSRVGTMTVFDMPRDISLHTDSVASFKRLVWLGKENFEHTLRLDTATVERFIFTNNGEKSSVSIVTSENLMSALSSR